MNLTKPNYGGTQYGRAYDASLITGDKCLTALAEWRYNLPSPQVKKVFDQVQLYGFADWGRIWNIDAPLGTAVEDEGSSAGIGIRFGRKEFSADLQLARTLNEPDSPGDVDDVQGFFSLTARY